MVTTYLWQRLSFLEHVCDAFQFFHVKATTLSKFQVTNKLVSVFQFILDVHNVARISSKFLHFITLPDSTSRMACMVSSLRNDFDSGS